MNRIALHGFTLSLPADWELSGLSGDTLRGYIVLARTFADRPGREAVVRVAWRRGAAVDAQRTLLALGRTFKGCGKQPERTAGTGTVRAGWWRHERDGWMAAVRTAGEVTLTAQALVPDTVLDLSLMELLAEADIADAARTTRWPWRLHGLALELPSAWRLRGLVHQAGLVRALWEHLPERGSRPDGLLVVRRVACADRVLAGGTPGDWLRRELHAGDVVERESASDGRFHLTLQRQGATWWRRWRGHREQVGLAAWCDEAGRLVVVERKGPGSGVRDLESDCPVMTDGIGRAEGTAHVLPSEGGRPVGASVAAGDGAGAAATTAGVAGHASSRPQTLSVPRLSLAPGVTRSHTAAGRVRLTAATPIRRRWWSRPVAALELDDIGAWVVERMDGRTVAALADDLAVHLRLTRREAEVALGDFVRQLVARGLVCLL